MNASGNDPVNARSGPRTGQPRAIPLRFDRGTIVTERWPDGLDPSELGLRRDERTGCWRAPASALAGIVDALADRGVASSGFCAPAALPCAMRRPALRDYQHAALAAWTACGRRGIVALPTGAGKTRVALAAIADLKRPALCLVPTRALLEQWCRAIGRTYDGPVGRLGDGRHAPGPLTVATFASANRRMEEIGGRFDVLVVDEAHHLGETLHVETLHLCSARSRLGLTATPERSRGACARELALGPIVFELARRDLRAHAAGLDALVLQLELTGAERRRYDAAIEVFDRALDAFRATSPGAGVRGFLSAGAGTPEGRAALRAWHAARRAVAWTAAKRRVLARLLEHHRDSRVLVFTADQDSCYAVAREHLVMPITSDIGRVEREAALEAFRRGELRVLVSPRVLNEGVDVPDAEVAVIVGGSISPREHAQRVGRILRIRPGKRARLYELVARATIEAGSFTRCSRRHREAACAPVTAPPPRPR